MRVLEVRAEFKRLLEEGRIVRAVAPHVDHDGDTIEMLNASFIADEVTIFGKPSPDYVRREIQWYLTQDRRLSAMEGPIPEIWRRVSSNVGTVNSNYGWCVFSEENGSQFDHCWRELAQNPRSRRACMIYQRPSMHVDAFDQSMSDFICTNAVHCFVREQSAGPPRLYYHVYMRSNDAVFGYKNDLAWHEFVYYLLLLYLRIVPELEILGTLPIFWNAASLHVYRRHWGLVDGSAEKKEKASE